MALQLTLSCDLDKSQSGPTLIHSTGVQDYKIPPEVIQILQENISTDLLSDHSDGVLIQDGPQRVLSVLRQNGFTLQKQTTDTNKALWTLIQSGGSSSGGQHPPAPQPTPSGGGQQPHPTPSGENDADAGAEDQGEEDQGENNEEGEEEGGEGEEEEES